MTISSFTSDIDPDLQYFSEFNDLVESGEQSNYHSPEEYNSLCSNNLPLKILSYNIRSFRANADSFFTIFNDHSLPDILVLTETWFSNEFKSEIPSYQGYHTIRQNSHASRSGGVSIFVRSSFSSKLIQNLSFSNDTIEICGIELDYFGERVIIIGIYRPHSDTVVNFTDCLAELINSNVQSNRMCVVIGDFNVNLLNQSSETSYFSNSMNTLFFLPCIWKPTRFSPSNLSEPSLLDQIWLNNSDFYFTSGIISHDLTDHLPIFVNINLKNKSNTTEQDMIRVTFRLKTEENRQIFFDKLNSFDWNSIKHDDVNLYVSKFTEVLNEIYCNSFPLKTKYVSSKKNFNPWINKSLRDLINAKSKYFQLYRMGLVNGLENNRFKNKVKSIIKKAKKLYYVRAFQSSKNNLKFTWKLIRDLISEGKLNKTIKSIFLNNIEYNTDLEIANAFNTYFSNVALDLDRNLPASAVDPISYLPPRNLNSLFLSPLSPNECSKIIRTIKITKQGRDCIPVKLFIEFHATFLPTVCGMVNQCFYSGVFPSMFKTAITVPIFKKGDKNLASNYRPISLLPFLSKIFEKALSNRIINFITSSNIFSSVQFGFLRNRSTEDAIVRLLDQNYSALNRRSHCINIL